MYATALLLKLRKNLGPAIKPTAVTNKAKPIDFTSENFAETEVAAPMPENQDIFNKASPFALVPNLASNASLILP